MNGAADKNLSGRTRLRRLRVTTQTKIRIRLRQHLAVDRAMGIMARGTPFAHRFMLEHERTRLFPMALRAALIQLRHREPTGRLENVSAMRVVALHTIHPAFDDRMMLGQIKFAVSGQVALETGFGIFAGIDDELSFAAAGRDVFAAGPVTGFATRFAGQRCFGEMNTRMRTRGKDPRVIAVTFETGLIADVSGAGNGRRRHDDTRHRRAGIEQQTQEAITDQCTESGQNADAPGADSTNMAG